MSTVQDHKRSDEIPLSINEWARGQRELLKLERDEETSQVADAIAQLTAQECMERGISLAPLAVKGLSTGLYGRACVSVGDPKGRPLPAHRLGAGDQVRLHSTKGSKGGKGDLEEGVSEILGVVGKVTELAVEVISDDADDAGSLRGPLRLDVVASEATHKKLMLGLDALEKYPGGGPAERVINVLFGLEPPSVVGAVASLPPRPHTGAAGAATSGTGTGTEDASSTALRSLNDSQREAVAFALSTRDVALIHGPPGTGKTTTVVALVKEAVARGWRCLVCAPSNVAVDGILERLVAPGGGAGSGSGGGGGGGTDGGRKSGSGGRPRVVRMGHPARLLPQVLEHSMDALVNRHEGTAIVKDVRKEIDGMLSKLYGKPGAESGGGKPSRSRVRGADRKGAKQEIKTLRKEARAREGQVVREVLRSRDVVLATCVGAATYSLREEEFDLVVIDEAAQALEAACWIPILKGRRLVLAGDHKQLAPTVKSRKAEVGLPPPSTAQPPPPRSSGPAAAAAAAAATDGLGLTMFDRILRDLGEGVCRMLDVQYRMNQDICDWASTEMYGGLLRAHPSVAERELPDLPHAAAAAAAIQDMDMWAAVMLLIDTTGCDMPEEEAGGGSRRNEREAEVAVRHVKGLLEAGILESEVAIISPYNGQVNLLKRMLHPEHPGVEVRSVDGFQGGEKEAIVLSLVRSNPGKQVGFLADARRLNVAVTRAKRHVAVICDAECCGSDAFIGRLLTHIEERGEYRSALELQPDGNGCGEVVGAAAVAAAATAGVRGSAARGSGDGGVGGGGGRGGGAGGHREQEVVADEDVLKRVQEFARRDLSPGEHQEELELPSELTGRQRALAHETAERLGLEHVSRGEGQQRTLVLSRSRATGGSAAGGTAGVHDDEGGEGSWSSSNSSSSSSRSGSETSNTRVSSGAVGDSSFSALMGGEDTEDDADEGPDAEDGPGKHAGEAAGTAAAAAVASAVAPVVSEGVPKTAALGATGAGASSPPMAPPAGAPEAARRGGSNTLLATLHAERVARRPPVPPPPSAQGKTTKKGGRRKGAGGAAPATDGDDRGFTIDLPSSGGGGGAKKSSKKGGSGSKKGKGKSGAGRVASGGGAGGGGKIKHGAKGASVAELDGDDGDDDLAFLDAQIKKERSAEPCYASLLRSTTEVMRQKNPRWAAAEDKGKPAKSFITGARRTQLKGALQTKLTEEEKKRVRRAGGEGEEKT